MWNLLLNEVPQRVTTYPGPGQVITTPGASCNGHDWPLVCSSFRGNFFGFTKSREWIFFLNRRKLTSLVISLILDTASQLIGACFLRFPVCLVVALAPSVYIHHNQVTGKYLLM